MLSLGRGHQAPCFGKQTEAVRSREGLGAFFPRIACDTLGTTAGKKKHHPLTAPAGKGNLGGEQEGAAQERQVNTCINGNTNKTLLFCAMSVKITFLS